MMDSDKNSKYFIIDVDMTMLDILNFKSDPIHNHMNFWDYHGLNPDDPTVYKENYGVNLPEGSNYFQDINYCLVPFMQSFLKELHVIKQVLLDERKKNINFQPEFLLISHTPAHFNNFHTKMRNITETRISHIMYYLNNFTCNIPLPLIRRPKFTLHLTDEVGDKVKILKQSRITGDKILYIMEDSYHELEAYLNIYSKYDEISWWVAKEVPWYNSCQDLIIDKTKRV